jgi:transcriptional regulator with XRE-family HTH domain
MRDLASWRGIARLTQGQLATRLGIARETLNRIERGRPTRTNIVQAIADALVLAPSVLIGYRDLDEDASSYRVCRDCNGRRPRRGFVRVKGTEYVYLRCRLCRAKRQRDTYASDPDKRKQEVARALESQRGRRLALLAASA